MTSTHIDIAYYARFILKKLRESKRLILIVHEDFIVIKKIKLNILLSRENNILI